MARRYIIELSTEDEEVCGELLRSALDHPDFQLRDGRGGEGPPDASVHAVPLTTTDGCMVAVRTEAGGRLVPLGRDAASSRALQEAVWSLLAEGSQAVYDQLLPVLGPTTGFTSAADAAQRRH